MTTRRQFLRGSVAAAVAASLPAAGDGVELMSIQHPVWKDAVPHAPALLPFTNDADTGIFSPSTDVLEIVVGGAKKITMGELKEFFNE